MIAYDYHIVYIATNGSKCSTVIPAHNAEAAKAAVAALQDCREVLSVRKVGTAKGASGGNS